MIDLYYWTTSNCHKQINIQPTVSEESKSVFFGQTAATGAV